MPVSVCLVVFVLMVWCLADDACMAVIVCKNGCGAQWGEELIAIGSA